MTIGLPKKIYNFKKDGVVVLLTLKPILWKAVKIYLQSKKLLFTWKMNSQKNLKYKKRVFFFFILREREILIFTFKWKAAEFSGCNPGQALPKEQLKEEYNWIIFANIVCLCLVYFILFSGRYVFKCSDANVFIFLVKNLFLLISGIS